MDPAGPAPSKLPGPAALFVFGGILFAAGLLFTTGEGDSVHWELRGPLWGLAALAALAGLITLSRRRAKG